MTVRRPRRVPRPGEIRVMLIVYIIRHLLGIALFSFLIRTAFPLGGNFWIVLTGLVTIYAGYVVYGTTRIGIEYRRSLRKTAAAVGTGN